MVTRHTSSETSSGFWSCMLEVLWVEMVKLKMVLAGKTITQYIQAVATVYFNV